MPAFIPHKHIQIEKTIDNIKTEIEGLDNALERIQDLASKRDTALDQLGQLPFKTYETKIKTDFYKELLLQIELSTEGQTEKTIIDPTKTNLKVGTTSQHTLVLYYLMKYAKLVDPYIDKTKYANLAYFLTGKSHDNIRKSWGKMYKDNNKALAQDLRAIRPLFEDIGAKEILKMIDNDLGG